MHPGIYLSFRSGVQPGISPWEFRESLIRALFVFCVLIPFLLIKLMKRTCCKRFIGFTPT